MEMSLTYLDRNFKPAFIRLEARQDLLANFKASSLEDNNQLAS